MIFLSLSPEKDLFLAGQRDCCRLRTAVNNFCSIIVVFDLTEAYIMAINIQNAATIAKLDRLGIDLSTLKTIGARDFLTSEVLYIIS